MSNVLLKLVILFAFLYTVYQNRYKLMNYLLGFSLLRKLAVKISMNLPNMRERFMQQAFGNLDNE